MHRLLRSHSLRCNPMHLLRSAASAPEASARTAGTGLAGCIIVPVSRVQPRRQQLCGRVSACCSLPQAPLTAASRAVNQYLVLCLRRTLQLCCGTPPLPPGSQPPAPVRYVSYRRSPCRETVATSPFLLQLTTACAPVMVDAAVLAPECAHGSLRFILGCRASFLHANPISHPLITDFSVASSTAHRWSTTATGCSATNSQGPSPDSAPCSLASFMACSDACATGCTSTVRLQTRKHAGCEVGATMRCRALLNPGTLVLSLDQKEMMQVLT